MSSETTTSKSESAVAEERASLELFERLRAATLGEYDILGELGRGGMATVFLAHEISLDRKVAIKVMSPALVHGAGMVERFKREARTAANLSHPNIIPIYTVREVDGLLFCVIKLVQGTALDLIMRELGQLPIAMVHGILAQVGGALGYAHRHGVVHRDIKPGNILIDDEGWAVVTDFGIAKTLLENEVKVTSTGMAIGTPVYMSPEQATADAITGASDQYSLGIVAYEMLTGRVPFTGSSMMAIMYSHFHDEPPSIRLMRPDCPDALCDAVMRMLRKAPEDRWPSMEEAVAAAGSRPLAPEDPTRTQLIALAKTGHTHRLIVQTTTPRSPIPKVGPRRGKARTRNPWLFGAGAVGLVGAGFVAAQMMSGKAASTDDNPTSPPAVTSVAESVTTPQAPRIDSTARIVVPDAAPRAVRQSQTLPADAGPKKSSAEGRANTPTPEPARSTTQRAESTVAPPPRKSDSIASVPLVAPPPVSTSASNPQTAASVSRPAPDPVADVTAIIQSYARALGSADLAAARRIYPGMPDDQREGLEAMWRGGGTMQPNWSVTDLVISADVATARITGSNIVVTGRGQTPTRVPVSLRARLERRNGEWRLVALIN